MISGFDISEHNGQIAWESVKFDGFFFAYLKATEGATYHDSTFKRNYAGAGARGLLRGAYCFARPKTSSSLDEANAFVLAMNDAGTFELPPVLDLEDNGGLSSAQLVAYVRTWMSRVKQLTGRQPILYTYSSFYIENGLHALSGIPLWIADYSSHASIDGWLFWQYTESGSVPGISGKVDLNKFNGTLDQLKQLGGNVMVNVDIKKLQSDLNTLDDAKLKVDGILGPLTNAAVEAFQKKYGIDANGINDATLKKIAELLAPKSQPVEPVVKPPTVEPKPASAPVVQPTPTPQPMPAPTPIAAPTPQHDTSTLLKRLVSLGQLSTLFRNRNYASLVVTALGTLKLVLNAFGVDFISDAQINDIANGAAAILAVAGVVMTHLKLRK